MGENPAFRVGEDGMSEIRITSFGVDEFLETHHVVGGYPFRRRDGEGMGRRHRPGDLVFHERGALAKDRVRDEETHHEGVHAGDADDKPRPEAAERPPPPRGG
jgi:hypothetical protein